MVASRAGLSSAGKRKLPEIISLCLLISETSLGLLTDCAGPGPVGGGGGAVAEGTRAGQRGGEAGSIPLEACHCWVTLLKLVDVSQSEHADV